MTTPAYLGATTAQPPKAAQVNQFLGSHSVTYITSGTVENQETTAGSGGVNTDGLYIAQTFTPSVTYGSSRMVLTLSVTGSPPPVIISIQTDSAGAPSGVPLAFIVAPAEYISGSPTALSFPILTTLFSANPYWIVIDAVGNGSNYYTWAKSNQVSGASTSPNTITWTSQAYGLLYQVFAGQNGTLTHTYEDAGARWTTFGFAGDGQVNTLREYTVAEGSNQYVYSNRAFAYTDGSTLTSIS